MPEDKPRSNQVRLLDVEPLWEGGRGEGVRVAVIDVGASHAPGLPEARVELVRADGRKPKPPPDPHGTFCASLIAGERAGLEGIAPGASVLSIQASSGSSLSPTLVRQGIQLALEKECDIISCSFVMSRINDELRGAVRDAHLKGVPVIVAAGNEPGARTDFPDKLPDVIVVSALRASHARMPGKHTRWTDIWSLGQRLHVPTPTGRRFLWVGKSSGATAVTAGVVALALARVSPAERRRLAPNLTSLLRETAIEGTHRVPGLDGPPLRLDPDAFVRAVTPKSNPEEPEDA